MFTERDFILTRSYDFPGKDCIYMLYFNSEYQRAVRKAIKAIMDRMLYEEGMTLVCALSCIVIKDRKGNEVGFEFLDDYNENLEDIEEYTMGYLAI